MSNIVEKLMDYYEKNPDDFASDLEELDSWNGILEDNRYYYMEDFDDLLCNTKPSEIARLIAYGDFSPSDNYFYFNGDGNLESSDEKDYSDFLSEYTIQNIIDNYNHLNLSDGAQEIIDAIDEDDSDSEI